MPFLSDAHTYPLWLNLIAFAVAAVVVWIGGTRLTGFVDQLSIRTGMGQAFAGMLLLGVITSLPELANAITASALGDPALAVNNLLGAASITIFLLALSDALVGREALTSVVAKPSTLMLSVLGMLVRILVAVAVVTGDVPVFGVGAWGLAIALVSLGAFWLAAGYGARSPWGVLRPGDTPAEDEGSDEAARQRSVRRLVLAIVVSGAVIFVAGIVLSHTGEAIARQTGLGSGLVGFLLIGAVTSMPELSTVVEALRRRRFELAFGQVLGTNLVNISMILVADLVFSGGPVINELGRFEVISSLLGAVLIGVFLVGLLERRNRTVLHMGYDALVVVGLFLAGVTLLVQL